MSDLIKLKKGLESNIPTLNLAEPGFATDEERLYLGGLNGNVPLPNKQDIDTINSTLADIVTVNVENFPLITPEVDDTARINRAIASFSGKSGKLLLPKPLYVISSDINVAIDYLIIEGNGWSTKIRCDNDSRIFYVTGAYVTIQNLFLEVTNASRTKFTCESHNATKTMYKNVYFNNTNGSLSGIYFNGGSMGLVENCMFNHSRINVETWDVKIDKCWVWALSQQYGIRAGGIGNLTITNTDMVSPFLSTVGGVAGLYIDNSSNVKFIGGYFDGGVDQNNVGCYISPNSFDVLLDSFSSNLMTSDVIVVDSAFGVIIKGGKFLNNNKSGNGSREIFIKQSSQRVEVLIEANTFIHTSTVTGTVAPAILLDSSCTDQTGIEIRNNHIKQPGGGGAYSDPEISGVDISSVRLGSNHGAISKYNAQGSMAVASSTSWVTIGALSAYPMAYEPLLSSYVFQTDFVFPNYKLQKNNRNSVHVVPDSATTASGNLYWKVEL